MAIALHASSPALAVANFADTATTSSFSPPAESLLVAKLAGFVDGTLAIAGGGLTWTKRVNRPAGSIYAEIWTAPCPAGATNITVTATASGASLGKYFGLKIDVYTGASLSTPAGNSGNGESTVNNLTVNGYTSAHANSLGVAVAVEQTVFDVAPTSTDTYTSAYIGSGVSVIEIRKAALTTTAGTVVTFNMDADGTGDAVWEWAALEIRPGSIPATINATTVDAAGDVPAASPSTGSTVAPGTADAAAEVPAPGVHAGQTVHAGSVDASAEVVAPNVVAGSAELVEPVTVTAAGDVPAPAVSAVANATVSAATVGAAGEVPDPAVTATFQAAISPDTVTAEAGVPAAAATVPTLPGDNITDVGQTELNGVVWGTGTSYRIRAITGWEELPPIDDLSGEEPARHGAYAGRSLAQRRTVTVALQLDSFSDPTQVDDLLRQLRYDTRILRDNTLWTFVARGYTEMRLGYCKVTDRTGVMADAYSVGAPDPVITLTFPDPRLYAPEQQSEVIVANASSPEELINAGDVQTNPTLRFSGPATNPMIINETLDRILAFDLTLTAGQILVVDTQLGKATIGSTDHASDISDTISVPIKEFFLDVGTSEISYETDADGLLGVEVLWRSAFL